MTGFPDQLMIQYLDPARVLNLLIPPDADDPKDRLRRLLASVYEPSTLQVNSVDSVDVDPPRFQVPVNTTVTVRGSWEKLLPDTAQARAVLEIPALLPPLWIDMVLETRVTARVGLTEGYLESLADEDLTGLTEAEFVAKFAFLDLAELMHSVGVTDYTELQKQLPHISRLHFAQPPLPDPNAPGRVFRLRVSVLIFPDLDLGGALRRLVQSRQALDESRPRPDEYDGGAVLAASAWLAVFPKAVLASPDAPGEKLVIELLEADGFVAAFDTP